MLILTSETMACGRSQFCSDLILYMYFICKASCVRALVHLPLQITQGRGKNICSLASFKLAARWEAEIPKWLLTCCTANGVFESFSNWGRSSWMNFHHFGTKYLPDSLSVGRTLSSNSNYIVEEVCEQRYFYGNVNIPKHLEIVLEWKNSLLGWQHF